MPKTARPPIAEWYCTYCGMELHRHGVSNKEHAVARQFFPEPRPVDLNKVVVPSCRTCNEAPKRDEDYVRGLLSLSRAALSDAGQRIHPVAMRALQKDRGLRDAIRRGLKRDVALRSPGGVYLGQAMTQTIAWDRVKRVLAKWARGLYFKEYGERLESSATFDVALTPLEQTREIVKPVQPSLGAWPGTFEYWHSRDDADRSRSRWAFLVWDAMGFIAVSNQPLDVLEVDVAP